MSNKSHKLRKRQQIAAARHRGQRVTSLFFNLTHTIKHSSENKREKISRKLTKLRKRTYFLLMKSLPHIFKLTGGQLICIQISLVSLANKSHIFSSVVLHTLKQDHKCYQVLRNKIFMLKLTIFNSMTKN